MDLLGNIGNEDQLIAAREEIKVLTIRVKELTEKVKVLTLEKETLRAEVEIYRSEAALPSFSKLALGQATSNNKNSTEILNRTDFVSPGNGIYATNPIVTIQNPHGFTNPLCCALNSNDSVLASGGADSTIGLSFWGAALQPSSSSSIFHLKCNAPVITLAFAKSPLLQNIIAIGCMDGSVELISYSQAYQDGGLTLKGQLLKTLDETASICTIKHNKYIKSIAWSNTNLLLSASADGVVYVSRILLQYSPIKGDKGDEDVMMLTDDADDVVHHVKVEKVTSFYLQGAVETACFLGDNILCLYEQNTPYLTYFDISDGNKSSKHSLNGSVNGGFDDHVSFTVMQLVLSPNGKYLCAATDSSRIIILDASSGYIVRNLYGHKSDSYFQPRVAWSQNGLYIYGNTQDDNSICVWDIASSAIVKRLDDKSCSGHSGQIRDLYSSSKSNTLVSASYDKTIKVWTCN